MVFLPSRRRLALRGRLARSGVFAGLGSWPSQENNERNRLITVCRLDDARDEQALASRNQGRSAAPFRRAAPLDSARKLCRRDSPVAAAGSGCGTGAGAGGVRGVGDRALSGGGAV